MTEASEFEIAVKPFQPPRWFDDALCAEVGGDWWFPDVGEHGLEAIAICQMCEVQNECYEFAMKHEETVGIWGGTSGTERKEELRRRREARD